MNRQTAIILTSIVFSIIAILSIPDVYAEVVSLTVDVQTILLEPGQVIPLLDTKSVGNMTKLQVSATLPCDGNHVPKLKIIAGALGNLTGVIDSSSDYGSLTGPFSTCFFSDTISTKSNLPILNKVFLKNDGSSSIITNLGSVVTLTGVITQNATNVEPACSNGLIFCDDFSTNNWTQVDGTDIAVDTSDQRVEHASHKDGRLYRSLSETLSNSGNWKMEFKFDPTGDPEAGRRYMLAWVSSGTEDPRTSGTQDTLGVSLGGGTNTWYQIAYKDGSGSHTESTNWNILADDGVDYIRLERIDTTQVTLSVFTDAAMTAHKSGSPNTITISSTLGDFDNVILGGDSGETAGNFNAILDDLRIQ